MSRRKAILWGSTGQARVLREVLHHDSTVVVAVFDNDERAESPFSDVPIHHGREGFDVWRSKFQQNDELGFVVAIGGERGRERLEIHDWLQTQALVAISALHPSAVVLTRTIGSGAQILAHATVCVEARLGASVIVNTAASVDHECILDDGVHIGPGAHLAGCVQIGACAMVGAGAVILPRVTIGAGAIVGAGAVVLSDVAPYQVVAGNPARVVGSRPSSSGL